MYDKSKVWLCSPLMTERVIKHEHRSSYAQQTLYVALIHISEEEVSIKRCRIGKSPLY